MTTTTIRPCQCTASDPSGVDIAYDNGLVLEQHFNGEMTRSRHGELLVIAQHPAAPDAYEMLNRPDGPCELPLNPAEAASFYVRLITSLLGALQLSRDDAFAWTSRMGGALGQFVAARVLQWEVEGPSQSWIDAARKYYRL